MLTDAGVDYVVVGGVSVVLHGHVRLTEDLDLVVPPDASEASKALDVLTRLGLRLQPREQEGAKLTFSDPPARRFADVFTDLPIPFSTLRAASTIMPLAHTSTRVVSIPHLVALKRLLNRAMDRIDIDDLETILRERARPAPEGPRDPDDWGDLSYEGARLSLLRLTMNWSPADRISRVEELLDFAYQAGALPRRPRHP